MEDKVIARIEPPGTLIFEDEETSYQVCRSVLNMYFDLKAQDRIISKIGEESRGGFVFLGSDGRPHAYVPLAITLSDLKLIRRKR